MLIHSLSTVYRHHAFLVPVNGSALGRRDFPLVGRAKQGQDLNLQPSGHEPLAFTRRTSTKATTPTWKSKASQASFRKLTFKASSLWSTAYVCLLLYMRKKLTA
jgi:hypothetical protein